MISNEKSVRLATRLLRVIERNPNTHPALNVIKDGIAERAGSFIKASEKWNTAMKLRVKERNEGLNAMNEFTATLRSYIPMIANSYPFLNISITNLIGTTPDDTLNFTDAIMEQIQAQPDFSTNTIANEFINNISPVWQNAMKEWAEYENSDSELRTASENMNTTKAVFHSDLSMFRKTLAAVVGRTHPDVRKLTLQSSAKHDPEDPQPPTDPATPNM